MRKVICSFGEGDHKHFLKLSSATFKDYASRFNYELELHYQRSQNQRPAAWGKIELIKNLLALYDLVLWIDADAIFVNTSGGDIADEIESNKPIYLVQHRIAREKIPNTGVLMLLKSSISFKLLDDIWNSTQFIEHPWWENAALIYLLGYKIDWPGYEIKPTFSEENSPYLPYIKFLDKKWNSIFADPADRPEIKHFAGCTNQERSLLLQNCLETYFNSQKLIPSTLEIF